MEGSGVPTRRVQCEIYPTNVGRDSVPEAKKIIRVGCDRVGVDVWGGGARPGDRIDHVEVLQGGGPSSRTKFPGASCAE